MFSGWEDQDPRGHQVRTQNMHQDQTSRQHRLGGGCISGSGSVECSFPGQGGEGVLVAQRKVQDFGQQGDGDCHTWSGLVRLLPLPHQRGHAAKQSQRKTVGASAKDEEGDHCMDGNLSVERDKWRAENIDVHRPKDLTVRVHRQAWAQAWRGTRAEGVTGTCDESTDEDGWNGGYQVDGTGPQHKRSGRRHASTTAQEG